MFHSNKEGSHEETALDYTTECWRISSPVVSHSTENDEKQRNNIDAFHLLDGFWCGFGDIN